MNAPAVHPRSIRDREEAQTMNDTAASHPTSTTPPARRLGQPTWIDLTIPDFATAKAFYGELFGWTFEDGGEEFAHYHRVLSGADTVAGMMPAMRPDGTPASADEVSATWTVYLATDDADATAAGIVEAGGDVVFGPMDVAGMGRMAFATDAAGAYVGIWQAAPFTGFTASTAPGHPCWFELMSSDEPAAEEFYREAFDWDIDVMPGSEDAGFRYATNAEGEAATAGVCDASSFLPAGAPGYWRMYIAVEDVDATLETVRRLGGSVLDGPMESPFGYVATVADPAGASFQVIDTTRRVQG